jgi:hypothetical protein
LTTIRLSIICSALVIFFDIILSGSYIFASLVCPPWFLFAVVRAVARRPSLGVASARVLIPLVTGLLVVANYTVQKKIAMRNAAQLIQACEHYRQANNAYPKRLGDLVPRYFSSVPRAKYCWLFSEFVYHASSDHILFWYEVPPFGRRVYTFESGTWVYID